MKRNKNEIDKLRNRLASKESLEAIFKDILKVKMDEEDLLLILQGNFLSAKEKYDTNRISLEDYQREESKTRSALLGILNRMEHDDKFAIFNTFLKRTEKIIEDLNELYTRGNLSESLIWSVSFLSIFAVGDDNAQFKSQQEEKLFSLLKEEKQLLLELATAGAELRFIICPVNPKNISDNLEVALYRTQKLIDFLKNQQSDPIIESALENIHWATTNFRQRNIYVIDDISFFEGYKKGGEKFGYELSTRTTYSEVILSNNQLYERYFDELSTKNLANPGWKEKIEITELSSTTLRRKSVVFKLKESEKFLKTLVEHKNQSK